MSEFDEGAPKKKGSWLVTCGILFVVLGFGFLAVAGIGGYYAWTVLYAPKEEAGIAGLLSVVNNSAAAASATCAATDGDAWTTTQDVPAGATAELEIGHRPAACTFTFGADSAAWTIKDPPASDESWTVTLAPATPVVAARTLTIRNRSGWMARATCTNDAATWNEVKDVFNGADVEVPVQDRPAKCTITAGMGSVTWTVGATEAPEDLWTVFVLASGDTVALSATETPAPPADAAVAVGTDPAPSTPGSTPATTASSGSTASTSTASSTSSSRATGSSSTGSTASTSSGGSSRSGTTTGGASRSGSTSTSTSSSTPASTSGSSASTGSGGATRAPPPPAEEEEEDEALPDTSVLTAIKVEWAKGAKKSTSWTVSLDGKKVGPIPTKSLVPTGVHKVKLAASGESPFDCTIAASGGEDIYFYFDPENPKCPK